MSVSERAVGMDFGRYLQDESGLKGFAETIVFPESLEEIQLTVAKAAEKNRTVTVQGGLTGLCGSAVPFGGTIMNLSHFTHRPVFSPEKNTVTVSAGTALQDLERFVREKTGGKYFFPVEPTEKTATIGGIIAQGAGGPTRLKYGGLSRYIRSLTTVDRNARAVTADGDRAVQYVGEEGMAGIIVEAELALMPSPPEVWSMVFFFRDALSAVEFSREAVQEDPLRLLTVLELFDRDMIRLMRENRETIPEMKQIPAMDPGYGAALLAEVGAESEAQIEDFASVLADRSAKYGCDAEQAWVVSGVKEAEKLRRLKHAATESICRYYLLPDIPENCRRTDFLLYGPALAESLAVFRRAVEEEKLHCCCCGHAGLEQVTVTLLPETEKDVERFAALREEYWRRYPPESIAEISEYGIGKTNAVPLPGRDVITEARRRLAGRSGGLFNPGNMAREAVLMQG